MGYTGYRVTQYIDDNPLSPTYGNTWTERELDTSHCPTGDDEWVLVATSCEATTSGFTGNMIYTYYNSATNQYSSTTASSTECDADSLNEIWVNSGDTFCEQDEDGIYSGWAIQVQVQRNSNLLNYNETREVRIPDATCEEHLEPNWTTIYSHCTIVADPVTGQLSYDGTLEELQIDDNPSSPTFNQTRVIYTPDEENCPAIICDEVERTWEFVDDICGSMMPIEYGLTGLTPDTLYHVYREYESCIVGGVPVKTEPTNRFSATTYQTSVTDCVERWVDTPQTVCIEEAFNGKWLATYASGTSSAQCDSSSAITNGEITKANLQSVEIGNCVTNIGGSAFEACSGLTSVTIPDSVTSIGNYTFYNCSGLTSVTIGSGITTINEGVFASCSGLTSVTIPDSVTSIGKAAFDDCTSLTSVTIPDSVTSIGQGAFWNCKSLTSVTIPNSVTSIGSQAFDWCSSLTSITIPNSVTLLGNQILQYCSGLTEIIIEATTPPILGASAFYGTNNCPIYVPCSSVNAYKNASSWSEYTSRIEGIPPCGEPPTPSTPKWITTYASGTSSAECDSSSAITQGEISVDGLLSVTIGDCVTLLGRPNNYVNRPFENAISLTSVTFGQNVNRIGGGSFRNCSGLTSIDIPSSVTYIGYSAFVNCKSLTSVTIPDSVTELGDSAFQNCYSLTSVNIGTGITRIESFTFDNCSGLTSVTIPSSVTRIDEGAFQQCKSLQSITVESTTPPLLSGTTVFNSTNNCNILVPCESVATFKTASGWSNYKSRIQGIPPCTKLKWIATYSGGTISSTTCNGSFDSITNGEIPNTNLLESVLINDCVGLIEARTFMNSSIKSIDKVGSYTNEIGIDYQAFKNSALEVYMPMRWNSKTWSEIHRGKIWAEAFYGCKLGRVIVAVDEMGDSAFNSNHYLTDLLVDTEVISDGAFYDCRSLTGVTMEDNVRTIGIYAFGDCRAMTTITIPSGVTSIGEGAFDYCTGLTEIIIEATTPPTLGVGAFDYTNNCPIRVPAASLSAYQSAWSAYSSRITALS